MYIAHGRPPERKDLVMATSNPDPLSFHNWCKYVNGRDCHGSPCPRDDPSFPIEALTPLLERPPFIYRSFDSVEIGVYPLPARRIAVQEIARCGPTSLHSHFGDPHEDIYLIVDQPALEIRVCWRSG